MPESVKLIGADARVLRIHTHKKTHCFSVPPVGGFSPPVDYLEDSVETLSPYEDSYRVVFIVMDLDWLTNEF